jgi:hypothetical protein
MYVHMYNVQDVVSVRSMYIESHIRHQHNPPVLMSCAVLYHVCLYVRYCTMYTCHVQYCTMYTCHVQYCTMYTCHVQYCTMYTCHVQYCTMYTCHVQYCTMYTCHVQYCTMYTCHVQYCTMYTCHMQYCTLCVYAVYASNNNHYSPKWIYASPWSSELISLQN